MNEVNEVIDVVSYSVKGRGVVVPLLFRWRGKKWKMKEIGLRHQVKEGEVLHHIFEGSNGNLNFRLDLNTRSLQWTLIATSDGLPH